MLHMAREEAPVSNKKSTSFEKLRIPSSKGTLSVVVTKPASETGKLAVLCPGYLDSKDYLHLKSLAKDLATLGYTVVRFEPTGTWESEGDISDYTTTQYLEDVKHVIDFMLDKGRYDHILIGGHSRGGMISLLYAARDPRVTAVVAIMPSSGRIFTPEMRKEWKQKGYRVSIRDLPNDPNKTRVYKVPYSHLLDREKYNLWEEVKKIRPPKLFLTGSLDTIVPPEDVKALYTMAAEPKHFVLLEGIDHDYRKNKKKIEKVNDAIISWVRNHGSS